MKWPAWLHATSLWHASHYVLLSALLFAGLELMFSIRQWVWALGCILITLLVVGNILLRFEERHNFEIKQAILPTLTATGFASFILFLPVTPLLHFYFIFVSVLFFFILKHAARQAYPNWNWAISTVVFFLNVASVLGWRYYLYSPIPMILVLIWTISWLLLWQALGRLNIPLGSAFLIASGAGLGLAEAAWVIQFLPLTHLAQAGVIAVLYYVIFHLVTLSFRRSLTRRDLVEYGTVSLVALGIILMSSPWM